MTDPDRPRRVLVVDDSSLMRRLLAEFFNTLGGWQVMTARDGADALDRLPGFDPDLVTLDINMPRMDGLTCLSNIMAQAPRPVIMISTLTAAGAAATLEALDLGAVDFITKPVAAPGSTLREMFPDLAAKVETALKVRPHSVDAASSVSEGSVRAALSGVSTGCCGGMSSKLVLIGASTGAPSTIETVLRSLPAEFPAPVVIAVHMAGAFTKAFAARLRSLLPFQVVEVSGTVPLEPGTVYVAAGGSDAVVSCDGTRASLSSTAPEDDGPHPGIDRLLLSAERALGASRLVAVVLTGMGRDGAAGMAALRLAGAATIAESASSALVPAMPLAVIAAGGAEEVLDRSAIAWRLVDLMQPG